MIAKFRRRIVALHRAHYWRDLAILFALITLALRGLVSPNPFDLTRPSEYLHDGLSHALLVKTVMEVGWYPTLTPWIGAPFGSPIYDYPFIDGLNFLLLRLIGLFSDEWVTVLGVFYAASFYLAALTAYVVLRIWRVSSPWAIAAAFLFTFLPYHLLRRAHLLLASYAVVPLGVWLASLAWRAPARRRPRVGGQIARVLTVVAVGSGGAYYVVFTMFLVSVAGVARALASRAWRAGLPAVTIVAGLWIVALANIAPSFLYWAEHGRNPDVAVRIPSHGEYYGFRLTQLVMPIREHRIQSLSDIANKYAYRAPLINENVMSSLGVVGSAGLGMLAVAGLARLAGAAVGPPMLYFASTMAVAAFVLGTIGGLGALLAYVISPIIRGYNRISVVLGFLSLAVVAMTFSTWLAPRMRSVSWSLALLLMLVGALDQIPARPVVQEDATFESDRAFVRTAEAKLPAGTMVLQYPYQVFPDGAPVEKMELYAPLRGYLNSRTLRWSYGAMLGRDGDRWIRALLELPPTEAVDRAARSGFGAIYVDRTGYADRGAALEASLRARLGAPIAESADGTLAMYRVEPTGTTPLPLAEVVPINQPIEFGVQKLGPLVASSSGISTPESWGRWTDGPVARLTLSRDLPPRFTLRLNILQAMPTSTGMDLVARAGGVERRFRVNAGETIVDLPFEGGTKTDTLEILIPNPRSPQELGMNSDARKLGVGLRSITILPAR